MYTNASILAVETAFVDAIKDQLGYLKTCRGYAGELDDLGEQSTRDKLRSLAPGVLVSFGSRRSRALGSDGFGRPHRRVMSFGHIVIASHLRGERRAATDRTAGAYAIMEELDTALLDQTLGLDIPTGITGGDVDPVIVTGPLVVYEVIYDIPIYRP